MIRFPWNNTKAVRGERETVISDSNVGGAPSPEAARSEEWSTSRRELWCFYLYYVVRFYFLLRTFFPIFYQGNNGLPGFNFGPSQFQNLLYLAGYDPSQPPFTKPCGSGTDCVLPYLGRVRNSPFFLPRPSSGHVPVGRE